MSRSRTPDEQHRRFDTFAVMAAGTTNLGATDDQHDLYSLVDAVVADIQVALPPFACKAGCNACCYTPPMVTSLEWEPLHRYLLGLPDQIQLQIVANAEALRPLAPHLQAKRQATVVGDQPMPRSISIQCPLLVEGRCGAYRARPMICRGYGFFVNTMDGEARFFGSDLAMIHIQATMPADVVLPRFDPYAERVGALHAGKGTQAYILQWLWAHIRDGRLVPNADLEPNFG